MANGFSVASTSMLLLFALSWTAVNSFVVVSPTAPLQQVDTASSSFIHHHHHGMALAHLSPRAFGLHRHDRHCRLALTMSDSADEHAAEEDIIGRRIIVSGDVQGGYIRSCILNEAGRFRRLIGTMTPPDDSDKAEIYVEGKRNMVEGFIRWCEKGSKKVGLSQRLTVEEVLEETPTGLYDGFYVRTGRED